MTRLEARLSAEIAQAGPISVAQFMAAALYEPQDGYYRTAAAIGRGGDFITAPEVSQMFGELIGLWAAQAYADLGAPEAFALIELGPGRGTLMVDALRALRASPAALAAVRPVLIEVHPGLKAQQQERLAAAPVAWAERLEAAPAGPCVIIANEVLDCLPIRQFVHTAHGWRERVVGLQGERLCFGLAPDPVPPRLLPAWALAAPVGSVAEIRPALEGVVAELAARLHASPGRALFIDYGAPASGPGDTLQAVRRHARADPLEAPGEVDLTAHVDFAAFAALAAAQGLQVRGPMAQGAFLNALGLAARTAALSAARPDLAPVIAGQAARLADPAQMGVLFQALCLSSPGLPHPAGFP